MTCENFCDSDVDLRVALKVNSKANSTSKRKMPGAGVPLGQRKRFEAEHSLKTALRAGGNLKGAIFFVYIRERFEYIPSHGYLETPLEEQCPMMKLLTESLGPKRAHEHTIKVKNDEPGFLCKLFTRVMKGNS